MPWIAGSKNWMAGAIAALSIAQFDSRSADRAVADLMEQPSVKAALAAAKASERDTIETQIRFSEIAAPPFREAARAEAVRRTFQQLGLRNVRIDRVGNVLGERAGSASRPSVVVAA